MSIRYRRDIQNVSVLCMFLSSDSAALCFRIVCGGISESIVSGKSYTVPEFYICIYLLV